MRQDIDGWHPLLYTTLILTTEQEDTMQMLLVVYQSTMRLCKPYVTQMYQLMWNPLLFLHQLLLMIKIQEVLVQETLLIGGDPR